MRSVANFGISIFFIMVGGAVISSSIFGPRTDLKSPFWIVVFLPLFLVAWIGGIVNIVYFVGWYQARCPYCDEIWAPRFSIWIEARCQHCGFDCVTCGREGGL
jgi:hypothetical protein